MRKDIESRKDEILSWIQEHMPIAEIAKQLGCARDTAYNWLKKLGIEYKGNQGLKGRKHDPKRKSALEIINSPNSSNSVKRKRLIEDGIKENKCEICGLDEWMGKPIPLELHHKDFNHWNNEIDNLQILCSNCHMQAHNYNNYKPPMAK